MKITALGVNSAFAVGTFEQGISAETALEIIKKLARSPEFTDDAPDEVITREIEKATRPLYNPTWNSNLLIELDAPGKRGKRP